MKLRMTLMMITVVLLALLAGREAVTITLRDWDWGVTQPWPKEDSDVTEMQAFSPNLDKVSKAASEAMKTTRVISTLKLPYQGKMVVIRGNQITEYGDVAAIIDPASTLKVPIAAWAITRQGGISDALKSTLTSALVISDNEAANELVRLAGGIEEVNRLFQAHIGSETQLSRFFARPGDSHRSTVRAMAQFLPGLVDEKSDLYPGLSPEDRQWLSNILSQTPAEAGFNRPNNWCRFSRRPGLQKCGVSAGNPAEFSLIAYFPDVQTYVAISLLQLGGVSSDEIIAAIDEAIELALGAAPTD